MNAYMTEFIYCFLSSLVWLVKAGLVQARSRIWVAFLGVQCSVIAYKPEHAAAVPVVSVDLE